jgi:hypothetical protein
MGARSRRVDPATMSIQPHIKPKPFHKMPRPTVRVVACHSLPSEAPRAFSFHSFCWRRRCGLHHALHCSFHHVERVRRPDARGQVPVTIPPPPVVVALAVLFKGPRRRAAQHVVDESVEQQVQVVFVVVVVVVVAVAILLLMERDDADPRRRPEPAGGNVASPIMLSSRRASWSLVSVITVAAITVAVVTPAHLLLLVVPGRVIDRERNREHGGGRVEHQWGDARDHPLKRMTMNDESAYRRLAQLLDCLPLSPSLFVTPPRAERTDTADVVPDLYEPNGLVGELAAIDRIPVAKEVVTLEGSHDGELIGQQQCYRLSRRRLVPRLVPGVHD